MAFCEHSPEDSALWASLNPDVAPGQTQVLGLIEWHLHFLRWAKTTDGQKNRNRPEPLPFLREKPEFTGMTPDEMDAFLGMSFRN